MLKIIYCLLYVDIIFSLICAGAILPFENIKEYFRNFKTILLVSICTEIFIFICIILPITYIVGTI